uniref:Uncharacterized protein n=1 Tax=Romanomermis culicivorax TaxID=13658 RepID=A0A915KTL7_ROMCU
MSNNPHMMLVEAIIFLKQGQKVAGQKVVDKETGIRAGAVAGAGGVVDLASEIEKLCYSKWRRKDPEEQDDMDEAEEEKESGHEQDSCVSDSDVLLPDKIPSNGAEYCNMVTM